MDGDKLCLERNFISRIFWEEFFQNFWREFFPEFPEFLDRTILLQNLFFPRNYFFGENFSRISRIFEEKFGIRSKVVRALEIRKWEFRDKPSAQ